MERSGYLLKTPRLPTMKTAYLLNMPCSVYIANPTYDIKHNCWVLKKDRRNGKQIIRENSPIFPKVIMFLKYGGKIIQEMFQIQSNLDSKFGQQLGEPGGHIFSIF